MIRVQWYYKKQDLDQSRLGLSNDEMEFIGENEVFPASHIDDIFADAIISKCIVLSINEYDKLPSIENNFTYFTRAAYCPQTKTLNPPYNSWERLCVCQ